MRPMIALLAGLLGIAVSLSTTAAPAEKIKIGFMTTLSGPQAEAGHLHLEAFRLGLEAAGNKLGGIPVELIVADDKLNPEGAVQTARKFVESDKVDFVTGVVFSNVMMAVYKPVVDSNTFFINSFSGPTTLSGENCHPYLFGAGLQNDSTYEAVGKYVSTLPNVKRVFIMAPNYQGGRDAVNGFKRHFKGEVIGEAYTRISQPDYSAEIAQARAAKPDAIYFFYPGAMGVTFIRQAHAAGLSVPMYSGSSIEESTVHAMGEAAAGKYTAAVYNDDLKNPENQAFVKLFMEKFNKKPSIYAALGFDSVKVIDAAVTAVKGDMSRKAEIRAALEKAQFKLVRGPMQFNTNHFPIQNFYLAQAVKTDAGMKLEYRGDIFTPHRDNYADKCKFK